MTTVAPSSGGLAPVAPSRRSSQGRGRFVLVVVLLAAAVGVLLYKGLLSSLDYYDTVDYALAHRAQIGTSNFRLEGVVGRTVDSTAQGADFSLSGANCKKVRVDFVGAPPELFQPGIPVVAVGRFSTATSSVFVSNQLLVRHSDKYVAAHPGRVKIPTTTC